MYIYVYICMYIYMFCDNHIYILYIYGQQCRNVQWEAGYF